MDYVYANTYVQNLLTLKILRVPIRACATHACMRLKKSKYSQKIKKMSHLEGLFSSERNPGRWFVCTASQKPPVQTWWRVMSETETKGE